VSIRKLAVYLDSVAELKRSFLKFLIFEEGFSAANVFSLGFFGTGAGAQEKERRQ